MSLTGFNGLAQLPDAPGYDPRTGDVIVRRWRGPEDAVLSAAASLRNEQIRYTIEPSLDGGYWMLVATLGADETQPPDLPLADTWALAGNDLEQSIWDHPRIHAQWARLRTAMYPFSDSVATQIQTLRRCIEEYVKGERTVTVNNAVLPIDLTIIETLVTLLGMDPSVFRALIEAMSLGAEAFSTSQWVLRHTLIISSRSSIRPSLFNVGRVFTTNHLRSVERIPPTIMFDLPDGWWLKRTPTAEQPAADKFTITQEWWHADTYDGFLYEVAS